LLSKAEPLDIPPEDIVAVVGGIAEHRIGAQVRGDDAAIEPPHGAIAPHDAEQAVLDLLDGIVAPVGIADLDALRLLVDAGRVVVEPELLDHLRQQPDRADLRFYPQVVSPASCQPPASRPGTMSPG
jgi:hypothetical protein